jgi:hypothetical protein
MAMSEQDSALFKSLLASEHGKLIERAIDARVAGALATYKQKHPDGKALLDRVQSIESSYEQKLKQAELRNKVVEKSYELKIPLSTIDRLGLIFNNEKEIDSKLTSLKQTIQEIENQKANEMVTSGSYRPGSGRSESGLTMSDISGMDKRDVDLLEQSGRLDKILKGRN